MKYLTFCFIHVLVQAKEHFGDPLESRQVDINGIEPLSNSTEWTVSFF